MDPARRRRGRPADAVRRPMNSANLLSLAPLAVLALTGGDRDGALAGSARGDAAPPDRRWIWHDLLSGRRRATTRRSRRPRYFWPTTRRRGSARRSIMLCGLAALGFQRGSPTGREAPALVALAASGALVTVAATHAVTLFLGLEITTLALVVLFAFPLGSRNLEAGYKYFLMAARRRRRAASRPRVRLRGDGRARLRGLGRAERDAHPRRRPSASPRWRSSSRSSRSTCGPRTCSTALRLPRPRWSASSPRRPSPSS